MNRAADDRYYDPQNFVRDYAQDEQLQLALEAAEKLSASIPQRLPGESELDAQHRIDQAFDLLRVDFDKHLDSFHKGELSSIKERFLDVKIMTIAILMKQVFYKVVLILIFKV